ncbi:MAG: TlpA disulfide reductase family protein [Candidatus Korobacteraceae bacterium]
MSESIRTAGKKLRKFKLRHYRYAAALGCLSIIAVLAAVFVAIPHWIESGAYRNVNQEITPFYIETLTGKNLSSEDWKGHVVVLSFWATWCTPCQAELPEIAALQAKYRDNPNVLIFALDSGNHGETPAKARAYLTKRKLMLNPAIDSFGVAPDEDSWGPAAKSLSVTSLPALYILDRSGRLRVIHLGYDSSEHLVDSLSDQIDELL